MMTKIKDNPDEESMRKEKLKKLTVEVLGSETAQSTFIEVIIIIIIY